MHQSYFLPKRYAPHKAPVWGFISAGNPLDPEPFSQFKRIPIPMGFRRFGMVAFQVTGDSMTLPDGSGLPHGCWALADRYDLLTDAGQLYAFRLEDGSMVVKRYRLWQGRAAMHSDNPAFEPIKIDRTIRNCGRVYAVRLDGRSWQPTKYKGWD